ncbi:uncharacterized protein F5891DRAFT_986287 [Suillus fuscotomentosus]|uniref:Uncharacterized protein n=1 Tax=Suillus fuscotomentosus TaxID=1912939 RepID=A0AAD4HDV6_9AGAM|nr:uncharacterized protein F5891DRAFT_986287 [Suillus fuscotomentosus]KAG1892963.1 hypothetical protein F5891DRAFT_986287 [Suillus fuscotomentosus]
MSMYTVKIRATGFFDFFRSGRFLFIGYAAHDYQLAPIYWPEEYQEFFEPSHNIIRHIGLLASDHNFSSSGFLEDIRPPFCGPSPQGLLCPIWVLERLNGIPFNPARFPNGFLTPVPPNSVNLPVQVSWNTFDPFVQQQSLSFSEMLLPLSMDFDNDRTVDLTVASTVDDMFESAFDDSSFLSNPLIIDGADVPHAELHWRLTVRDDSLDCNQKKSLKLALLTSCWGRPIKLASHIYVGHILVGMPANPFSMREPDCRQLITTSFLRALHLNLKTYEQIREIPLTVVNNVDSKTCVYWSQLRTRFLDYPIDFTSELRKVVRGGTTPDAGFGNKTEQEAQMKLHIIDLMNSGDENMIQEAICQLIATQGFMEILWASLYRPIADFPQGQARLADLYPEAIQTLTGYLGKGIVGVLVTLMYQSFIPAHADRIQLKTLEVYPHIMSALDVMYANPFRFETFFDVARKLPHIREANVLSIDPKTRNARLILDLVTNDRYSPVLLHNASASIVKIRISYSCFESMNEITRRRLRDIQAGRLQCRSQDMNILDESVECPSQHNTTLTIPQQENMATLASQQQSATLSDRGIGIWPTQLPRYAEVVSLTDDAYEDNLVCKREISDPPIRRLARNAYMLTNLRNSRSLQTLDGFVNASRAAAKEDAWTLVVQPTVFMGEERFQYYYVVPGSRIIAWLEDLDGYILFRACVKPSEWRHKRLELEAQYWKHFEYFPHDLRMSRSEVRCIRGELVCYLAEATTLRQSTVASIFWTLDEMNQIVGQLAYVEEITENDLVPETRVVSCCLQNHVHATNIGHHQYLHRHNQPEACLIRTHTVREKHRKFKLLHFMGNAAATMFCMPITIARVKSTSVDGIINGVEVQSFINDFSSQTRNQITLAGISMALDIAILAIPWLGLLSAKEDGDASGYYKHTDLFLHIELAHGITISVTTSILGFLAGITIDFKPSAPSVIACFAMLAVVVVTVQAQLG